MILSCQCGWSAPRRARAQSTRLWSLHKMCRPISKTCKRSVRFSSMEGPNVPGTITTFNVLGTNTLGSRLCGSPHDKQGSGNVSPSKEYTQAGADIFNSGYFQPWHI